MYRGIFMQESFEKKKHTLFMENREVLELSGIVDVASFNEEEISAKCDWGDLLIKGEGLHLDALDLETGTVRVGGKVTALVYHESTLGKGFFGRVFS